MRKDMLPGLGPTTQTNTYSVEAAVGPTIAVAVSGEETLPSTGGDEADGLFRPSENQIKMKHRFWSRWAPSFSETDPTKVTLARVCALTQSETIRRWWIQPGFRHWFMNPQVHQEKLSHLLHLSMMAIEDMLLNTDPKAQGARASAVKMTIELVEKIEGMNAPLKDKQTEALQTMSQDEIVSIIAKATGLKLAKE